MIMKVRQVTNMNNIKNCPFCGNVCEIYYSKELNAYRVECSFDSYHKLDCWDDTEKEAIERWNKRYQPSFHDVEEFYKEK